MIPLTKFFKSLHPLLRWLIVALGASAAGVRTDLVAGRLGSLLLCFQRGDAVQRMHYQGKIT